MAAILPTNIAQRHVMGDLVARFFDLSGNNGDTLTLPNPGIRDVIITPTTAIAVGATWPAGGAVITFVTAGAWAARVMVLSREG